MTRAEQAKLDATAAALRALLAHATALPFDAQPLDAIVQARAALAQLTPTPKRERVTCWRFWYGAAMGVRMVDDSWGWPLAPGVDPTWHRAKLILRAGGGAQTVAEYRERTHADECPGCPIDADADAA